MSVLPDLLAIEEEDAGRPAIEALLRDLPEPALRALWTRTRTAAAEARIAGDMTRRFCWCAAPRRSSASPAREAS